MFLNFREKIVSRNHYMNLLTGSRRIGKSFGAKEFLLSSAIKYDRKFIYMRRYKGELKNTSIKKMFDELIKSEDFKYDVDLCSVKREDKMFRMFYDKKEIGLCFSLSQGYNTKSVVVDNYDYLLFDEFLIPRGSKVHYLPNEVIIFLETIASFISNSHDFKGIYLIANKMSFNNPYFNYYKIPVFKGENYYVKEKDLMVYNFKASTELKERLQNTGFGKLIADTAYGNYFFDNESLEDNNDFISKKFKGNAVYTFQFNGNLISLYSGLDEFWFSPKIDKDRPIFNVTRSDNTVNTISIRGDRYLIKAIKEMYQQSRILYSDIKTKSICYEMFDILNIY